VPSEHRLLRPTLRRLALQGGVFTAEQAGSFLAQSGARDAVLLRQWDDLAKQAELDTPPLAHFLARAARCRIEKSNPTPA